MKKNSNLPIFYNGGFMYVDPEESLKQGLRLLSEALKISQNTNNKKNKSIET